MSHNEQDLAKQLQIELKRQAMMEAEAAVNKKNKQISNAAARMAKFIQYLRDNMDPFEKDKLLKDAKELAVLQAVLDRAKSDYETSLHEVDAPLPQLLSVDVLSPVLSATMSSSPESSSFATVYSQPSTSSVWSTPLFSSPQPLLSSGYTAEPSTFTSALSLFSVPLPQYSATVHKVPSSSTQALDLSAAPDLTLSTVHGSTASSSLFPSSTSSSGSSLQSSASSFSSGSLLTPLPTTILASSDSDDDIDLFGLIDEESFRQSQLQLDEFHHEQTIKIQAQLEKLHQLNRCLDLYLDFQQLEDITTANQYLANVKYLVDIARKVHGIASNIAGNGVLKNELNPLTLELAAIHVKADTYQRWLSHKFGDALIVVSPYTIEQIAADINTFNFVECNIEEVVSNHASADAETRQSARVEFTRYHQALENAIQLRAEYRAILATDDEIFASINQVIALALRASVRAQNIDNPDLQLYANHSDVDAPVGDASVHTPSLDQSGFLSLSCSASSSVDDGAPVSDASSANDPASELGDEYELAKIQALTDSIHRSYELILNATEVNEPNKFLANANYRLNRALFIRDQAASWTEPPVNPAILASMTEKIAAAQTDVGLIKTKLVSLYGDVIDDNGQANDIAAIESSIVVPLQNVIDLGLDDMDFDSKDYKPIIQAASNLADFEQKLNNAHAQREEQLDLLVTDDQALARVDSAIEAAEDQLNDAKNKMARHLDALAKVIAAKYQQVLTRCDDEDVLDYAQLKADMDAIDAAHALISAVADIDNGSEESNSAKQKLQVANRQRTAAWQSFLPVAVNVYRKKAQNIYTIEREALNNFNPTEIGAAAKLARAKARLLAAHDALEQARKCVALYKHEDEHRFLAEIAVDESNLTSLTHEVATWESQQDSCPRTFLLRNSPYVANILIEKNGALQGFVDKVIRKGDRFNEGLGTAEVATTPDLNGSYSGITYENARLREGDVIRSHINFNRVDARSGRPVIGVLKQGHSAQVSNFSRGLTDVEQTVVAFKQAQMLLNNYKPGSGDIILRGENTALANKVYAALLLLTDSHPQFYNLEIKSFVPGCTGPYFFTRSFFINKHLGEGLSEELRNTAQDTLRETTEMRFFRLEKYYKNKAEIYRDPKLLEGESLDIKGQVLPNRYRMDYYGQPQENQPNLGDFTELPPHESPTYQGS